MPCADSNTICARRHVTTEPRTPAHDLHHPPALIIIDLTQPQSFRHWLSLQDQHPQQSAPQAGKRDLLRH
jgi:hypothetical protein